MGVMGDSLTGGRISICATHEALEVVTPIKYALSVFVAPWNH